MHIFSAATAGSPRWATVSTGKTLGVLGLGKIGSEVARIGLAFGMNVIAYFQNLTPDKAQACGSAPRLQGGTLP